MAELEHVGIAVDDMEATLRVLEDVLQVSPYKTESVEKDRIRTHFIHGGGVKLELLESVEADSPVTRFLEKRGPGLHHLAFEVDDIESAYRRLSEIGYQPLEDAPRPGADGKRIFFLHPKDTAGVLVEFCMSERSVLSDAVTSGELRIRRSASRGGPTIAYLHGPDPDPAPDVLARILEQRFSIQAIEAPAETDARALREAISGAKAIVAAGVLVAPALRLVAEVGPAALVLIHPPDHLWPVKLSCPGLIIGRDGDTLDTVLEARASIPECALAVLPEGDAVLVAELIEQHLVKARVGA